MLVHNLEVYAAASLREAFTTIARDFERAHPGVKVRLQFAGSQALAAQISNGAPADVLASADARNLDKIAYDPKTRRVFATNRLVVVSPGGKVNLQDLPNVTRLVLAASAVPAGGYARETFVQARERFGNDWYVQTERRVVSEEPDVRAVLAKVALGEADAGIVYASDAVGVKGVVATPIPADLQPRIEYPAAVPKGAHEPKLAKAFVDFLMSRAGKRALAARGFGPPP